MALVSTFIFSNPTFSQTQTRPNPSQADHKYFVRSTKVWDPKVGAYLITEYFYNPTNNSEAINGWYEWKKPTENVNKTPTSNSQSKTSNINSTSNKNYQNNQETFGNVLGNSLLIGVGTAIIDAIFDSKKENYVSESPVKDEIPEEAWWEEKEKKSTEFFGGMDTISPENNWYYGTTKFQQNIKTGIYMAGEYATPFVKIIESGQKNEKQIREEGVENWFEKKVEEEIIGEEYTPESESPQTILIIDNEILNLFPTSITGFVKPPEETFENSEKAGEDLQIWLNEQMQEEKEVDFLFVKPMGDNMYYYFKLIGKENAFPNYNESSKVASYIALKYLFPKGELIIEGAKGLEKEVEDAVNWFEKR